MKSLLAMPQAVCLLQMKWWWYYLEFGNGFHCISKLHPAYTPLQSPTRDKRIRYGSENLIPYFHSPLLQNIPRKYLSALVHSWRPGDVIGWLSQERGGTTSKRVRVISLLHSIQIIVLFTQIRLLICPEPTGYIQPSFSAWAMRPFWTFYRFYWNINWNNNGTPRADQRVIVKKNFYLCRHPSQQFLGVSGVLFPLSTVGVDCVECTKSLKNNPFSNFRTTIRSSISTRRQSSNFVINLTRDLSNPPHLPLSISLVSGNWDPTERPQRRYVLATPGSVIGTSPRNSTRNDNSSENLLLTGTPYHESPQSQGQSY